MVATQQAATGGPDIASFISTGLICCLSDRSRPRPNGATATFRRTSGATNLSQRADGQINNIATSSATSSASTAYVPPHLNYGSFTSLNRNGNDTRYSKDQLLDMFRTQLDKTQTQYPVEDLFVDGWTPDKPNGLSNGGWGRSDDQKDTNGPEICWDHTGGVQPLGIIPMSDVEKEAFSTSVNSPIKLPAQNKEGMPNTPGPNRRTSVTQAGANSSASRPSGRQRRDSSDLLQSSNHVASPTNNRFSKDESTVASPPPSLLRRKTDFKDGFGPALEDKDKDSPRPGNDASPFGTLKRTSTNPLGASLNSPSSPWLAAPNSAGFAPMGAFGAFGAPQNLTEKKSGFGSMRSESRFKSLMGGDLPESTPKPKEKTSLQRLAESGNEQSRSPWENPASSRRRERTDLYEDDDDQLPAGSAALLGDGTSPAPITQATRTRNLEGHTSYEDIGFSSIPTGSDLPFREFSQRNRDYNNQRIPHQSHVQPQLGEPLSPTYTNPYQSPEGEKAVPEDLDTGDPDLNQLHYQQNGPFARGYNNPMDPAGDRGQNVGTSGSRAFPHLGGLGNIGALGANPWSAAPGAVGTPSRAFGEPGFGAYGDVNSPGQGGFGGGGFFGSTGPASAGLPAGTARGGKLNSLFPSAMQDQIRGEPPRQDQGFGDHDAFVRAPGTNAPGFAGGSMRDTDSPSHASRSRLDDLLNSNSDDRQRGLQKSQPAYPANEPSQTPTSTNFYGSSQEPDQSAVNQLPPSQQRQMVMPDRMRWIYRDPQGNQQGPWSGLEMHDWYKAGFFSPELQVKKLEDGDYEPLAQLIRRIGNSREPFLVPQIGIPHGPPSAPPNAASSAAPATTPTPGSGAAQPPFASSFPSFGTTLTAEQQNALERRKQEEQYLMARQKEHLASIQPQISQRMGMQGGLHNQQLHHHSSAHSLHSQPSYGSITSPVGYQPSPAAGPIQPPAPASGFFDGMSRYQQGPLNSDNLGSVREEDLPGFMERMNLARGGQMPQANAPQSQEQYHQQQVNAAILQERARLQREQEQYDQSQRGADDARVTAERLEEYHRLRSQEEGQQRLQHQQQQQQQHQGPIGGHIPRQPDAQRGFPNEAQANEEPSLSEQVQKAAAKQSPSMQPQSPWAKIDTGAPQPFPPAQSSSPMPAPTPQRNRQSVADALNAESQSQTPSQTDSAETPGAAMAPWAKDNVEGSRGPSLKEIQATEARKAAEQEKIAAAARKAVAERELLAAQQSQSAAPEPGLPSSANWASSMSPAAPPSSAGGSPWTKPTVGKPSVATPVTAAKKTLAQIQKEEEARKNRAAAAAAASASVAGNMSAGAGGKRYADLASKAALPNPSANSGNSAWTTVGASGKVKASVAPTPAPGSRAASGSVVSAVPGAAASKAKPSVSTSVKSSGSQASATEDFQKWTRSALKDRLNSGISR